MAFQFMKFLVNNAGLVVPTVSVRGKNESDVYVHTNVPTYPITILSKEGELNFRRLVIDRHFSEAIGLTGIDFSQGGSLWKLASTARPLPGHYKTQEGFSAAYREAKELEQSLFKNAFTSDELQRIKDASYYSFAKEHGLQRLLELPSVQAEFNLTGTQQRQLSIELEEHIREIRRFSRPLLIEVFERLVAELSEVQSSELSSLFEIEADEIEECPRQVLEACLAPNSPHRTVFQSGDRDHIDAFLRQQSTLDLLLELRVACHRDLLAIDESKIKPMFDKDCPFQIADGERNVHKSNQFVEERLDDCEIQAVASQFWLRMLHQEHFIGFFENTAVIDRLELSFSEAKRMTRLAEKLAEMLDVRLGEERVGHERLLRLKSSKELEAFLEHLLRQ